MVPIIGIWGEPAATEAYMTSQQPEAHHVFSRGTCPLIGTLAVAYCTGSRGGVDSDLCLHMGFLGDCSSSISISCPSLGSALIATARSCLWSSFRWCSESPLLAYLETMVSGLLGRSRLFPRTPSRLAVVHYPPSGCVHAANPSPLPGI